MYNIEILAIAVSLFVATSGVLWKIHHTTIQKLRSECDQLRIKTVQLEREKARAETVVDHISLDETLSMAKACAVEKEWSRAAKYYEIAIKIKEDDWQIYYQLGKAYANTRKETCCVKAILAYSTAIALMPADRSDERSRLHILRGGIWKRLGRLDEALPDILLGVRSTGNSEVLNDGLYNLACIYAMQDDRKSFDDIINQMDIEDDFLFRKLRDGLQRYAPSYSKYIQVSGD